jgi:RimJ/RimL family protein N-acetyltransferase
VLIGGFDGAMNVRGGYRAPSYASGTMPAPSYVRAATAADVPEVLPMVAAICAMHEALDPARYAMLPDVVARYQQWLPIRAVDPRSVFLVAESDDDSHPRRIVGFLVAQAQENIPIYRLVEYGFIHDVWVEPSHRGRGFARELVRMALDHFGAMGVTQVRLETASANESARRLFESCGFRAATMDMLAELPQRNSGH